MKDGFRGVEVIIGIKKPVDRRIAGENALKSIRR